MKNQIPSSLSSQTIYNTGKVLYKSQGNYSRRHTVPVLPLDKKENTSIFSTAQFILFLLYSTHSSQPKKIKTEPC
jgi:glutathionyl-hydroquinone reductase